MITLSSNDSDPSPAISVCLPTYNGERFIRESIGSVLAQEDVCMEVIVVDDASEDSTLALVRGLGDERIRAFQNPQRLGLVKNWNRCLGLAAGELVCIWHQDDIMLPGNLSEKRDAFRADPNLGLVYSSIRQIDERGQPVPGYSHWAKGNPPQDRVFQQKEGFDWLFDQENIVCCPSVVFRRACYLGLGGFDERLPFCADWEMWMRIALYYRIAFISKPLVAYRWHKRQETNSFIGTPDHTRQRFLARHLALARAGDHVADSKYRSVINRLNMAEEAVREAELAHSEHRYAAARKFLLLALRLNPRLALDERAVKAARSLPNERIRRAYRRMRTRIGRREN